MSEDFNQFIKGKLDALDHTPGVAWDETAAWNRLAARLPAGAASGAAWKRWLLPATLAVLLGSVVWYGHHLLRTQQRQLLYLQRHSAMAKSQHEAETAQLQTELTRLQTRNQFLEAALREKTPPARPPAAPGRAQPRALPRKPVTSATQLKPEAAVRPGLSTADTAAASNATAAPASASDAVKPAIIHVYRPSRMAGFMNTWVLIVNGKPAVRIKNNSYHLLTVPAGRLQLRVHNKMLVVDAQPGRHHYVRCSQAPVVGFLYPIAELLEVAPSTAEGELVAIKKGK